MAKLTKEELQEIFQAVKKEVGAFAKGDLKVKIDTAEKYDLSSVKEGIIALGKPRKEMNLVTVALHSTYVVIHYLPLYTNCDEVTEQLPAELLKLLKAKTCFHITTTDKETMKGIKQAMKVGCDVYKKNGWL